jgi:hypothetical protein
VEETLGKPKGQFAAGGLTIWTYPQVEVEFRDGVVSQVQWRKTPPAPERPAATNAVAEDRSRQQTEEPTRLKKPVRERSPGGTARSASSLPSPSVEPANRSPPSRSPASSPQGVEAVANPIKVMVLSFDPPVPSAGGKRVHEAVEAVLKSPWNDPRKLADACISDFVAASSGNAGFTIAIWKDMDELPRSVNGKQYTPDQYLEALRAAVKDRWNFWAWPGWLVHESRFDYGHYIARENLADKVRSGQIDEVS